MARSRFEPSNTSAFESVEDTLREICRSYEHYLRLLLNRIRRSPIKTSEASYYRLDYLRLREALGSYDWRELEVYFLPFRLMRPRYFSINTIYELFIFVTARGTHSPTQWPGLSASSKCSRWSPGKLRRPTPCS